MRSTSLITTMLAAAFVAGAQGKPSETVYVSKLVSKELPFSTVYQFDRSLAPGRMEKIRRGQNGRLIQMVQHAACGGKRVSSRVLWQRRQEPLSAIIAIGRGGFLTSRGGFTRKQVMTMEATGYCKCFRCCRDSSGVTAAGLMAGFGIAAVDPRVIPLGSHLFVEGYGFALAGDVGGAVKHRRIDLCFDSHAAALRFGRRMVRVHILG